jgi:hypothetical protein
MVPNPGARAGLNVVVKRFCNGRYNTHKNDVIHYDGLWEKRPVEEQLLRYAAGEVDLLREACIAMSSDVHMSLDAVMHRTETEVLEVQLRNVMRGPASIRVAVTKKYSSLSCELKDQITADAFYKYLLANSALRRRCQDIAECKLEFFKWKATASVPNNPPGTKYQSSYPKLLGQLARRGVLTNRGVGDDVRVMVWSVDVGAGHTVDDVRRTASAFVRENRAQIEADKFGARVGPIVGLPETVSMGEEVRFTARVENAGSTPLVLRTASFLQVVGSRTRKPVFQARVHDLPWPVQIPPRSFVDVAITCTPTFGINRDLLELDFGDFSVGRYLEVSAGDALLFDALKPVSPFKKKKRRGTRLHPSFSSATSAL